MRKCIETGNPWHLGLLEYLCTPISDQIPAPSELLNRRYRGVQPFLHFTPNHSTASFLPKEKIQDEQHKHQELNKFHYNKSSVAQRNEICEGSNVLVYKQTRDQNIGVRVLCYIAKTRHMTYS